MGDTFRSDETPAIGEMVGQLFGNSNGQQQAGMLNQILAALGPTAAASLAGGVLGRVMNPGSNQITPDQASQLSYAKNLPSFLAAVQIRCLALWLRIS